SRRVQRPQADAIQPAEDRSSMTPARALRIDVHPHPSPGRLVKHLTALGVAWRAGGPTSSLAARLDDLDRADTDIQVIELGARQPYLPMREKAVQAARYANDVYREELDRAGDRYAAFGC